jgi:shikimate kinase/3-dehydroquinate synthase
VNLRSMNSRSVVLTGFMGTGKTTVGQLVARLLEREFVDMDAVIEARQGQPISTIFAQHGQATFRQTESALCAELGRRDGLVVAAGGGALVNPLNREQFAQALVVCLDATTDAILARLGDVSSRPLLAGDNPYERIQALLDARRKAYAQIAHHADTTNKTIEQVAEEVVRLEMGGWQLGQVHRMAVTTPDGEYPILVGAGLLTQIGATLREAGQHLSSRCAVVTHPTVGKLYATGVMNSLRAAGWEPCTIEIPDGERFKTLETVSAVYDQLIDARLDRSSAILALGGGVVGDLAGFVAATFLRGVPFVQLPTTLLAIVDSSVGGKVAVDHPRGKNLIGAFKQPFAVVADTDTLGTLPDEEWRSGMAEVVKHGILCGEELFEKLEAGNGRSEIGDWLARAVQVKVDAVTRDPFEQGERAKLNLGHTFGHALEKLSHFDMRHGDAVAIGLLCAVRLAMRLDLCDASLVTRVDQLLRAIGLPTRVPQSLASKAILDAMLTDKKRANGRLRFVLPRAMGDVVILDDIAHGAVAQAIDASR